MLGGVTTYYIGNTIEWTGSTSTMVKYYYAGGQRVAMRKGTANPTYLLGDHLGSTSISANSNGTLSSETRYHPWGATRYSNGTAPTSFQYTGQRNDAGIGLYFYNARYYDPALGRFLQADTIVPSPGNPQSFNRYSYTLNNPLKYVDPSGHAPAWWDYLMGATTQYLVDMSQGGMDLFLDKTISPFWDLRTNEDFQSGQEAGRVASQISGVVATADGVSKIIGGAAALIPTIPGGAVCTVGTGGVCAAPSVAVVAGEVALVAAGVGEVGYGLGVVSYAKNHPVGNPGSRSRDWAAKSSQTRTIRGRDVRIDWESPGSNGNVHITVDGQKVYITDPSDLSALPKALRENQWIQREIQHAFEQLNKFQMPQ